MSWNDNDIDQLFRGATPETPPFQEEFWNEMEVLLPVQKRRKAGFWWFTGSAAMIALIGMSLVWWKNSSNSTNQTMTPSTRAHVDTSELQKTKTVEQSTTETEQTAVNNGQTEPIQTNPSVQNRMNTTKKLTDQLPKKRTVNYLSAERIETYGMDDPTEPISNEQPTYVFSTLKPLTVVARPTLSLESPGLPRIYPDPVKPKAERFYAQLAIGVGQSYQYKVVGTSNFLHYYALGGGLYKRIDHMVLTFGANARIDFSQNIVNSEVTPNHQIDTKYSQLYSFETPMSIGFQFGRNTIGATVTPGFQMAFTGKETERINDVTVRTDRTYGNVNNGKTLTMEVGVNYWRTLTPNWYAGAAFNIDAIRPFNPANFAGQQRLLPVNAQLTLRRTF